MVPTSFQFVAVAVVIFLNGLIGYYYLGISPAGIRVRMTATIVVLGGWFFMQQMKPTPVLMLMAGLLFLVYAFGTKIGQSLREKRDRKAPVT